MLNVVFLQAWRVHNTFLVKAKKIEHKLFQNFDEKHKAPAGLKVIATPNSYMMNEVWKKMSKDFASSLRILPIFKTIRVHIILLYGFLPWTTWFHPAHIHMRSGQHISMNSPVASRNI